MTLFHYTPISIESLLTPPHSGVTPSKSAYTVPTIHHIPTNTYVMDSIAISEFLESTYPSYPVPLRSELGRELEFKARGIGGVLFKTSILPREMNLITPRAQQYFRRTREAALGHPLEDLLDAEKEDAAWKAKEEDMQAVGELMTTHKDEGPFVLGAKPSGTDFWIAGTLRAAKVVDEGVFARYVRFSGYKAVYEACLPYMEKKD